MKRLQHIFYTFDSFEVLKNVTDWDEYMIQKPDIHTFADFVITNSLDLDFLGELLQTPFSFVSECIGGITLVEVCSDWIEKFKLLKEDQLAELASKWTLLCLPESFNPFDTMGHFVELRSLLLRNKEPKSLYVVLNYRQSYPIK